ncbi:hypothetical protein JJQ94_08060 [Pseudoalteromonas sp. GCY]|uniref:hypothetical protein n=1 Tax=Pseudoalteromonas sp. GCY TaxID=2003316 RepID=UPI001916FAC1|nr:hypothetical protein [Pseudoalteromonas sp. GCY]QQQ67755.1 hypothetical protein JJQ94_08060 [Pseudoalteromonas sp. GCY]
MVVIKNLLVAVSTIILVALASNNLSSQDLIVISVFILFLNLQNALFDGLFGLHLLSLSTQVSSALIVKQFKYMLIVPFLTSLLFWLYMRLFVSYLLDDLFYISVFSFFIFISGVVSNSVTNVYCNQNDKALYFLLDIFMLICSVLFVFYESDSLICYMLPFVFRSLGTFFLYTFLSFKKVKNRIVYSDDKLISGRFFASTVLSVSRDSLMPLVIGMLLGPNILVLMRIFNTIVSAPGLLANSMNKVVVRYLSQDKLNSQIILGRYRVFLIAMSSGYLLLWFFGDGELVRLLFSDKFDIESNLYLFLSLGLFCFFWPFGQVVIVDSLNNGDSHIYLKMSVVWTAAALVNFLVLYYTSFEVYMICFGLIQIINLLLYFRFFISDKRV